ncbi:MAG: Rieske (2Fe-2S) protein [Deltaproteobacteria bacterium]|nr:Rieske (2Fe-2S) protein [Deltaproteobacteria bacterium]
MGLVDDLAADTPVVEISRRKALGVLTAAAAGVAAAGTAVMAVRFMRPNVLFEPPSKFVVGRPDEIPIGSLVAMPKQKLYIVRGADGFYAMSATCTHLGCMTQHRAAEKRFICPCHGSSFDLQGNVLGGPAPRALDRRWLGIEDGMLVVDTRKPAPQGDVLRV